jgi:hypothetical protein
MSAHDTLSILFEEERFQFNYTHAYRRASFWARRVLFVYVLISEIHHPRVSAESNI